MRCRGGRRDTPHFVGSFTAAGNRISGLDFNIVAQLKLEKFLRPLRRGGILGFLYARVHPQIAMNKFPALFCFGLASTHPRPPTKQLESYIMIPLVAGNLADEISQVALCVFPKI